TDAAALSLALREGNASVEVDGEKVDLAPDEVIITETPREGWSVASDAGATVALDLEITEELRRAGLARDAIRLIQEARKNSGLDVADRIALRWTAHDPATVAALEEHAGLIADEVLATDLARGEAGDTYGPAVTARGLAPAEPAGLTADEVLATDFARGEADDTYGTPFTDEGLSLTFRLRRV